MYGIKFFFVIFPNNKVSAIRCHSISIQFFVTCFTVKKKLTGFHCFLERVANLPFVGLLSVAVFYGPIMN
jgi:hypothetical protein